MMTQVDNMGGNKMQKLAVILSLIFLLTACNSSPSDNLKENETPATNVKENENLV